jgi:hypothetical protein
MKNLITELLEKNSIQCEWDGDLLLVSPQVGASAVLDLIVQSRLHYCPTVLETELSY